MLANTSDSSQASRLSAIDLAAALACMRRNEGDRGAHAVMQSARRDEGRKFFSALSCPPRRAPFALAK